MIGTSLNYALSFTAVHALGLVDNPWCICVWGGAPVRAVCQERENTNVLSSGGLVGASL